MCSILWLVVAGSAAACARNVCAAPALSNPVAQRATHRLYNLASWLGCGPVPVALVVQPSPSDECTTLLVALQFAASALVPLLLTGLEEARLFQHHQRQRWLARLPLERGAQAAAYDYIWWVRWHRCLLALWVGGRARAAQRRFHPVLPACPAPEQVGDAGRRPRRHRLWLVGAALRLLVPLRLLLLAGLAGQLRPGRQRQLSSARRHLPPAAGPALAALTAALHSCVPFAVWSAHPAMAHYTACRYPATCNRRLNMRREQCPGEACMGGQDGATGAQQRRSS